jgi:hypothetical protein
MYQDSSDGRFVAETMMMKELIPHIDMTYRTIADLKARCIVTVRATPSSARFGWRGEYVHANSCASVQTILTSD